MSDEETMFKVVGGGPTKELLRIVPTETGWDIVIPDGTTLTEAAQTFIDAVNDLLGRRSDQ